MAITVILVEKLILTPGTPEFVQLSPAFLSFFFFSFFFFFDNHVKFSWLWPGAVLQLFSCVRTVYLVRKDHLSAVVNKDLFY